MVRNRYAIGSRRASALTCSVANEWWSSTMCRALLIVFFACTLGCGGLAARSVARNAANEATPVVIDRALLTVEEPQTRGRIAAVISSPEVTAAVHDVGSALFAGGLEAIASEESGEALGRLVEQIMRAFVPDIVAAARLAARSAARGIADEIPTTIFPAIHRSFANELASPGAGAAIDSATRDISRSAVHGVRDGLDEVDKERMAAGKSRPLANLLDLSSWVLIAIFVMVGSIVLVVVGWAFRSRRRAERYRRAILAAVTDAGSNADDKVKRLVASLVGERV
jgi:hypothetical protein